jgi:hypothetical protein
MACVHQKFQFVQIFSKLQKPVCSKLSVCKIINVKLFFVNIVILTSTKVSELCFNKTGNYIDYFLMLVIQFTMQINISALCTVLIS